nr:1-phosphatidylinositol 4,5-bisphosphate phosphodiesterase delta-4 isoform X1 [Ciona intestinalis]|eukprot:XP_002129990.1 1-phosphatidylinositol 4,5-bisphosphate phosphodiesterase delta-4 isoform X1 [Ciona intestinalis]
MKRPKTKTGPAVQHVFTDGIRVKEHNYVPTDIDMSLSAMEEGAFFIKVKSAHWRKTRHIELSRDHLNLHISHQSCGKSSFSIVDIKKINEIRIGYQSPIWERLGHHLPDAEQCFSLVIDGREQPLNLVSMTKESAELWTRGLQHLSANLENLDIKGKRLLWVWDCFKTADKDQSGKLSYKEVKKLLDKLNFQATSDYIDRVLKDTDISGDNLLSFDEFSDFFKKISWRPEVERLYKTYCDADLKLQPKELARFLREDQGLNDVTEETAMSLVKSFEPDENLRSTHVMSIYGFMYFLLSPHCDVFNAKERKVHMDMTRPLSHYYIASSHNTYLADDQLIGKSSVECYIRALERGCRCVELDCWDGEDGQPIIYHGYTLTSKIAFADVVEAIRDYAFKTSDYPVILSIENHCSVPQQKKMALIMKETLGDMLLQNPVDPSSHMLPSPEALKGRILVKGKRLKETNEDEEVSDEDEAADVEENGVKKNPSKTNKKIKLSKELSDLVIYAQSRHFHNFPDAKHNSDFRHISSLNEDKAMNLYNSQAEEFSEHNQWQLVRIYPKGTRTNSSNYDPLALWNVGCQIVALNYQTEDRETHINDALFRRNGGCGYVIKPDCLLTGKFNPSTVTNKSPFAQPSRLQIRVISAQQLPKPITSKKSDVIDPYVIVSVTGCDVDKQSKTTSVVDDNGFNPTWENDLVITFDVIVPQLAFITFDVMDKDSMGDDDLVGTYTLPYNSIANGYRHVHLGSIGSKPLLPSTLFINVKKT